MKEFLLFYILFSKITATSNFLKHNNIKIQFFFSLTKLVDFSGADCVK